MFAQSLNALNFIDYFASNVEFESFFINYFFWNSNRFAMQMDDEDSDAEQAPLYDNEGWTSNV